MKNLQDMDPSTNAVVQKMVAGMLAAGTGWLTKFMVSSEPVLRWVALVLTVIGALFTVIIGLPKVWGALCWCAAFVTRIYRRLRPKR